MIVGNKNRLYYRAFRPKAQPPQPTAQCNRQEKAFNTLLESLKSAILIKKAAALLLTCGYRPEKGCDLFEEGMRRYCKHAGLRYLGSHAERHLGYDTVFMDADKDARTRAFARELMGAV